ncbi:MAG: potassium uptake protein, TrkH family, partial [Clostridiales bacterium]|nr:potassium uptake protein, TrkH family [Clostridiales bacterium]
FDLMGQIEPFSSMSSYVSEHSVNVTIMLLITMGGLGFWVLNDIYKAKKLKYLSVHTKIVLISSAVLILGGTGLFLLWEHSNDATLGLLSHGDKVIAAMFQSITARTAGFNSISQTGLTEQSRALMIILMLIGGSPGSTAGGIKTVTAVVLLLSAYASLKGKHEVSVMGRKISSAQIMNALALFVFAIVTVIVSTLAISTIESIPFGDVLYETSSAFGTVGISMGITPTLGAVSRIILILIMFMGRIGVLTMGYIVLARKRDRANIEYPDANLMIG